MVYLLLVDALSSRYTTRTSRATEPSDLASSTNVCSMGNALSKPVFLLGAALPEVYLHCRIALPGSLRLPASFRLHLESWKIYAAFAGIVAP